jgi:uncharacterized protein YuzE
MKRYYTTVAGILTILLFAGFSDAKEHDGNYWVDMGTNDKIHYISGWMDSGFVFLYYSKMIEDTFKKQKQEYEKKFSSMTETQRKQSDEWKVETSSLTALYYEQSKLELLKARVFLAADPSAIIDGVNSFYGDYRNRKISVPWAIYYVLESIRGKPEKNMQRYLEHMRKIVADGSLHPNYAPDIE